MSAVDPSQHRVLLVGPRAVQLKGALERRRYRVDAAQRGIEGMTALDAEPTDVVLLELDLGDLTAAEFLIAARQTHPKTSFLLLDDPAKATQIVRALQVGLDGYVQLPADEQHLFFELERHLGAPERASMESGFEASTTQITRPLEPASRLGTLRGATEDAGEALPLEQDAACGATSRAAAQLRMVRDALIGHVDGDLDEGQAIRLRERLAMASVLETEIQALRRELQAAHEARREQQERADAFQRCLTTDRASCGLSSREETPLQAKVDELESDNMVLAERIMELEDLLEAKTAEGAQHAQRATEQALMLERVQRHRGEMQALRERNLALEAMRVELEERARRGDADAGQAAAARAAFRREREQLTSQRDAALAARQVVVERVQRLEAELSGQIAALESELRREQEARRAEAATFASTDDVVRRQANEIAAMSAARDAMERERRTAQDQLLEVERRAGEERSALRRALDLADERLQAFQRQALGDQERLAARQKLGGEDGRA